jgi:integrase
MGSVGSDVGSENSTPRKSAQNRSRVRRTLHRLTAAAVNRQSKPGKYADGGQLWLQVSKWGTKSWLFRYNRHGKDRWHGLGSVDTLSLAEARERARHCRRLLLDGIDPIDHRKAQRAQARLEAARAMTFQECAEAYIQAHRLSWKNPKHAAQWPSSLSTYVYPVLGDLPVPDIDTQLVLKALEPIWTLKPETASRVRGRIELVLDWATARQYREGENPARWRGHLDKLLPARSKLRRVKHHAALPYKDVSAFMLDVGAQEGVSARALEFAILTAARTGEVIGATWDEIDLVERLWVIPPDRMKAGKEHRIPLSDRAVELLESLPREGHYVFPGGRARKPLSNMAMLKTLRRMDRGDLTVHGFRSTFRDWCAEQTAYPHEAAEMALAHSVGDKVEAAYRRGDMFEKRRRLMHDWAEFCASPIAGNIVPIRSGP